MRTGIILSVLFSAVFSLSASAGTSRTVELSERSDAVFVGRLVFKHQGAEWFRYTVEATIVFKGTVPKRFNVSLELLAGGKHPQIIGGDERYVFFVNREKGNSYTLTSPTGSFLLATDRLKKELADLFPPTMKPYTPPDITGTGKDPDGTKQINPPDQKDPVEGPSRESVTADQLSKIKTASTDIWLIGKVKKIGPWPGEASAGNTGADGTKTSSVKSGSMVQLSVHYPLIGGLQFGTDISFRVPATPTKPPVPGLQPMPLPGVNEFILAHLVWNGSHYSVPSAYDGVEPLGNRDAAAVRAESILASKSVAAYWAARGGYTHPLRITRQATAQMWQRAWNSQEASLERIIACYSRQNPLRRAYLSENINQRKDMVNAFNRFHETGVRLSLQLMRELPRLVDAGQKNVIRVEARLIYRYPSGRRTSLGCTPVETNAEQHPGSRLVPPPPGSKEASPRKIVVTFILERGEWLILDEGF